MNKLSIEERERVVAALVEGNSLRAVTRMTGVHRTTVMKLLCHLGRAWSEYQDKAFRNLKSRRIRTLLSADLGKRIISRRAISPNCRKDIELSPSGLPRLAAPPSKSS